MSLTSSQRFTNFAEYYRKSDYDSAIHELELISKCKYTEIEGNTSVILADAHCKLAAVYLKISQDSNYHRFSANYIQRHIAHHSSEVVRMYNRTRLVGKKMLKNAQTILDHLDSKKEISDLPQKFFNKIDVYLGASNDIQQTDFNFEKSNNQESDTLDS